MTLYLVVKRCFNQLFWIAREVYYFFNDISQSWSSTGVRNKLFADDTKLYIVLQDDSA
jgi:hypothetical protein